MKKLTLDLDALCVDTFDTLPMHRSLRGTVDAYDSYTDPVDCIDGGGGGGTYVPRQIQTLQQNCITDQTGGTGGGGGGASNQCVTQFQSCNGTCYDASCAGTCAGQATCNAQICIPF